MQYFRKILNRICIFSILAGSAFFIFIEVYGNAPHGKSSYFAGGKSSRFLTETLEHINAIVEKSDYILKADLKGMQFMDEQNDVHSFYWKDNALWHNDDLLLINIHAFNLEYRDGSGNLIIRSNLNAEDIASVGYTIRRSTGNNDFYAFFRIYRIKSQSLNPADSHKMMRFANNTF